jgi:hypothetical protein
MTGNINFPTSDESLGLLAKEFAKVSPAVPNVVAAVDSVVFETIAPQPEAYDEDKKAATSSIGSAFNRHICTCILCEAVELHTCAQKRVLCSDSFGVC